MSVLKAEAKNFKILSDLTIDLNGESALIVGDSGKGKTAFMNMIQAHLNQIPYPKNPLKEGENEGFTRTTHDFKGKIYTITRKYKRLEDGTVKLDRFKVTDPNGGSGSPEAMLSNILGEAFGNSKFDFNEFFIKSLSPEARLKYFIKAIGGEVIETNQAKIKELEGERGVIGTQRATQRAVWENASFSAERVEQDKDYYNKVVDLKDAEVEKQKVLATLQPDTELKKQLSDDEDLTLQLSLAEVEINAQKEEIRKLEEQLALKRSALKKDEDELKVLEKGKLSTKQVEGIKNKLIKLESVNSKIREAADEVYNTKLEEIITFKSEKKSFEDTIGAFKEWKRLEEEWNKLDKQIADKRAENEAAFKSRIPLPELTIGEVDGKPVVMYNGREFNYDNFSTGECIKITSQIQRILNPTGDNFIVVHQGQSLGSKMAEVITECQQFGVQFLIEVTRPDEEFGVEFIEAEIPAKKASLKVKKTK